MGATDNRGYRYPELSTQPPDAAGWLATGLGDVDDDVQVLVNRLQYGPVSGKPPTLAPGYFYFAFEG